MASTGLLVISNPLKLGWLLHLIQSQVRRTLYIQLFPGWTLGEWSSGVSNQPTDNTYIARLSRIVSGIYSQATALCHHLDVRMLLHPLSTCVRRPLDIVFYEQSSNADSMLAFLSSSLGVEASSCSLVAVEGSQGGTLPSKPPSAEEFSPKHTDRQYEHVVLGGTFDRLHNGHKELLSQAIIRCRTKLTVGVTDTGMVKSKVLHELIEPCEERIEKVRKFLQDVNETLIYDVVPISDPFGPTKEDATMDMIVVSAETARGGQKVNELRVSRGLAPLQVHSVELVEDLAELRDPEGCEDVKVSSSSARIRLLGTLIREPQSKPDIPAQPYVIGLTGGIASGKSAIGDRLEKLGAGVINCDLLGHEVYLPGTKGHALLCQEFGTRILDSDGTVNRRALGSIVFSDKDQLARLNALLWPLMLDLVEERLAKMREAGTSVAVVEAAVLARAGWDHRCHEVWSVIVPPEEAIRRLQERNSLSEEEARQRLAAQPSNETHVAAAHVVFSPMWSPEHTGRQVQRAWQLLQARLLASSRL